MGTTRPKCGEGSMPVLGAERSDTCADVRDYFTDSGIFAGHGCAANAGIRIDGDY